MYTRALLAAMAREGAIVLVFILDPTLRSSPYTGDNRIAFLAGGIRELDREVV
jgi:hypothetical protein